MNIFYLDDDPLFMAQYHHDVHLRKMIVESAQLLSNVHHVYHSEARAEVYQPAYLKHPCTLWILQCEYNYRKMINILSELSCEYEHRFDKSHKTILNIWDALDECTPEYPEQDPPITRATQVPLVMPECYRIPGNPVESYRAYYHTKLVDKNGKSIAKWTNRETPPWLNISLLQQAS